MSLPELGSTLSGPHGKSREQVQPGSVLLTKREEKRDSLGYWLENRVVPDKNFELFCGLIDKTCTLTVDQFR